MPIQAPCCRIIFTEINIVLGAASLFVCKALTSCCFNLFKYRTLHMIWWGWHKFIKVHNALAKVAQNVRVVWFCLHRFNKYIHILGEERQETEARQERCHSRRWWRNPVQKLRSNHAWVGRFEFFVRRYVRISSRAKIFPFDRHELIDEVFGVSFKNIANFWGCYEHILQAKMFFARTFGARVLKGHLLETRRVCQKSRFVSLHLLRSVGKVSENLFHCVTLFGRADGTFSDQ